jgi:uncharacterized protein (TIGR01777 family)
MAGASGFLGRHLAARLSSDGHRVERLVRRRAEEPGEVAWDPDGGELDSGVLEGADAVINLCGAGVADRRWTETYKRLIRDSRVNATRAIAEAVAVARVPVLLNGSAVGYYGDNPAVVDETAEPGDDFLGVTCRRWEEATAPAAEAGARVVPLRTGHVMAPDSVMLKRLIPLFKLGLGGRFGSGRQYFPWISLRDWLAAVDLLLDRDIAGPVNLVGPTPVTNAEFTRALGAALRRPTPWVVPGAALRFGAGEAAVELLRGTEIVPKVLRDNDFEFSDPTISEALTWAVASR